MSALDLQQHNVYLAEQRWIDQAGFPLLSYRECKQRIRLIQMTSVWKSLSPTAGSVVLKDDGEDRSYSFTESGSVINVAVNHRKMPVLIHEMSHALMMRVFGPTALQAHGPQFVSIYRMLVEELMPEHLDSWDESFSKVSIQRDDKRVRRRQRFATAAEL